MEPDVSADVADFYRRNPLDPLDLLGPEVSRKPWVVEHSSRVGLAGAVGGAGLPLGHEAEA